MNDSAKKAFDNFNFTLDDDILSSHGDDFTEVPSEEPHVSPYQAARNISYNGFQYKKVTALLFLLLLITNV